MTRAPFKIHTLVAVMAALAGAAGCAGKGDIDRTQPDKIEKAIFFNPDGSAKTFYYRWTVTDVPPTNGWLFEGVQGAMDKIYFKVTQDQLIGYRAYDYAPGSQNAITGGANNTDAPVVSFKITSHFDVKREYNAGTGEQTNVISENTTDRPWNERQFLRVDWSTDKLANPFMDVTLQVPVAGTYAVSETEITNPGRAIYTKDYLDVTIQTEATPDYNACIKLFAAPDDVGPWDCGPTQISLRHSFRAVSDTEYEPLEYPDVQPLLDAAGKPISVVWAQDGPHPCNNTTLSQTGGTFSGADCSTVGAEEFSKFGFFRTVRQTYDPRLGASEVNRKYYANRWNIWQKTIQRVTDGTPVLDANGNVVRIPDRTRVPRQIPYYTNVEFPDDDPMLWDAAQQVVGEWNDAMKRTVAALRAPGSSSGVSEANVINAAGPNPPAGTPAVGGTAVIPDIFVLKRNSCNVEGVKQYLTDHPDMADELKVKAQATMRTIDPATLDKTTTGPGVHACWRLSRRRCRTRTRKKFTWQRNGDLRYSFVYWVDRPQGAASAPLGYGPSSADPETGEIVSASLYLYGASLNIYTQFAADSVDMLNGVLTADDLLSGKRISDVLAETAKNRTNREALVISPAARAYASALATNGGLPGVRAGGAAPGPGATSTTAASRLVTVDPLAVDQKLATLKGTAVETAMMTEDILTAFVPGYIPGRTNLNDIAPDALAKASPIQWLSEGARQSRRDRFQKLAMNGCVFTADFADDAILGTALKLKLANLTGDALFKTLRASIFRGLADHEMGHTMGLRHNFAGSTDALNYGKDYWQIRSNVAKTDWAANSLDEHEYSTVMDYGSRFNTDVQGLGRYDYAAIRFGYGQLIDTMPNAQESANQLSYDIFFGDYSTIPTLVGGSDVVDDTSIVRYATAVSALQTGYRDLATNRGSFSGIVPERPYKFCSDEFEGNLDCKTWDRGASQQEIINNTIDLFKNYYAFNAYQRGRVNWTIDGYLSRLTGRYFNRYSEAFQFYYFFGAAFRGSFLTDDLLGAAMLSLNALGEVLQTPEPGTHCATDSNPNVLILATGFGTQTCYNDDPQPKISLPDGKPYYIAFSNDYYYRITRAGSLYEKLAALISLTTTTVQVLPRRHLRRSRPLLDQLLPVVQGPDAQPAVGRDPQ